MSSFHSYPPLILPAGRAQDTPLSSKMSSSSSSPSKVSYRLILLLSCQQDRGGQGALQRLSRFCPVIVLQNCPLQYCTATHCNPLQSTAIVLRRTPHIVHFTSLCCDSLRCTAQHWIALYSTAQLCTAGLIAAHHHYYYYYHYRCDHHHHQQQSSSPSHL